MLNTLLETGVQQFSVATCDKCNRKRYFRVQCFSKTVAIISTGAGTARDFEDPYKDQPTFFGSVSSTEKASWSVDLCLKQKTLTFKLDTRAEVTAISEDAYQRPIGEPRLQELTKTLCGPTRQSLKVRGQFLGWLRHGTKSTRRRIYVVRGLKTNLLGLPAIQDLQLICRLDATELVQSEAVKQFPTVFQGLGTIGEEYCIKLRDEAKLYSLFVPGNRS